MVAETHHLLYLTINSEEGGPTGINGGSGLSVEQRVQSRRGQIFRREGRRRKKEEGVKSLVD